MSVNKLLVFIITMSALSLNAQSEDELSIIGVIDQLFDGMRANDSMMIKSLFIPDASMSSIFVNPQGEVVKQSGSSKNFITAVGRPREQLWDEKIWSYDIKIDGPMAQAWTEYTFYLDNQLSHCGVNVFELIHLEDGWKIGSITDTRRRNGCKIKERAEINALVDQWHLAAASANDTLFFGSMTEDGIYIGTDASERWTRNEMKVWAKKYFDRESAWSFTPVSRNLTMSEDKTIGWFDELLDTWMGTCRASGVVVRTDDGWKIKHYHLSIAVPNDKVEGYLELIGKPGN